MKTISEALAEQIEALYNLHHAQELAKEFIKKIKKLQREATQMETTDHARQEEHLPSKLVVQHKAAPNWYRIRSFCQRSRPPNFKLLNYAKCLILCGLFLEYLWRSQDIVLPLHTEREPKPSPTRNNKMKEFEIIIGIRAVNDDITDRYQISAATYEDAFEKALEMRRKEFDEDAGAYIADIIEL